jgi:hypothetical protein
MSNTVINTAISLDPDPSRATAEPRMILTPEGVIAALRSVQSQIDDAAPLSKEQRTRVRRRLRTLPATVVEASINVIGVLDNVSQAIGRPLDEVRQLQDESLRWDAVTEEIRAFLKRMEGSNLVRKQQLARIASQAYMIGSQLAQDSDNAVLLPHVEEVKRLKKLSRRKKAAQGTPSPAPVPVPSIEPQR